LAALTSTHRMAAEQEGDAAVNDLFKKIYAGADPDAQRAMLKSYQESGGSSPWCPSGPCRAAGRLIHATSFIYAGTTLSTNWAEIGQKKTEVKPPDGMEAKKWE
jgi:suppressor of G2 allele of SKP1